MHKNIVISTTFSMRFVCLFVSKNSMVSKDRIFYFLWYKVIRLSSHICKNLLFSHSIVLLVKFSDTVKLTNCGKVGWGEKWHYASNILFEWLNLLFYCHIILYWEKVTSYKKFSHNFNLEGQIAQNASILML